MYAVRHPQLGYTRRGLTGIVHLKTNRSTCTCGFGLASVTAKIVCLTKNSRSDVIYPTQGKKAGSDQNKKPTGRLLGACSGQHPMGYRFSLLTLLFSGVFILIKPQNQTQYRLIL